MKTSASIDRTQTNQEQVAMAGAIVVPETHSHPTMGKTARYLGIYVLLVTSAILVLVPLEWVIASSFTTRETVWKNVLPFNWHAFIPEV